MMELLTRKSMRIAEYDYSIPDAYFITMCTANRENHFWHECRGDLRSPANIPLSGVGLIVRNKLEKMDTFYTAVRLKKYCIMPDHIHMILSIDADSDGRTQFAPTISRIVKQFKGSVTKQIGISI